MRDSVQAIFLWVVGIVVAFLLLMFFNNESIDKGNKKVIGIILAVLFVVGMILYEGD